MAKEPDDFGQFSALLFEKMKEVDRGIPLLELYEFRYALKNLNPSGGWQNIPVEDADSVVEKINSLSFFRAIELKPKSEGKIVLDNAVEGMTRMLFTGLACGRYSPEWVRKYFYFDVRGFVFLPRTEYFTGPVIRHFGGTPLMQFEKKQEIFETYQGVGYRDFRQANRETDEALAAAIEKAIAGKGTPLVIGIAGPTAAGKTEFTEFLNLRLANSGMKVTSIEMDNFFLDRDYREMTGAGSMGKEAIHFALLKKALEDIRSGKTIEIPRYDFVKATSSHDNGGSLRNGCSPVTVEPADIIYIEGNFPFLFDEVLPLIDIKLVYLTDDPVRLKRKWKRDIDYRKKYDPCYFINRYFKTQFPKAFECYLPQLERADLAADTTCACIWATESLRKLISC